MTEAPPIARSDLDLILRETEQLWAEVRNQRIFITGGTGFFGTWLLESFSHINRKLSLNARATVLTRSPDAFRAKCPYLAVDESIEFITVDVRSFDFPNGEFRYVIHAAT